MEEKKINDWGVDIELFSHQKNSVLMMERLENERTVETRTVKSVSNIGILGDKVGTGKTLTVVSLLSRSPKYSKIKDNKNIIEHNNIKIDLSSRLVTKHFNSIDLNNEYFVKTTKYVQTHYYLDTNVILVSPLTLKHWEKELSHSNLKYLSVYKDTDLDNFSEEYDVILIVYNKFNSFVMSLQKSFENTNRKYYEFLIRRLIIDEICFINNMLRLEADFFWILTTRYNICNIYTESQMTRCFLKRLLASINISAIVIKNTSNELQLSFELPNIIETKYICHSIFTNFQSDFLSYDVKKMISADDLKSAIEYLGGYTTLNINLQDVVLNKEREVLKRYEAKLKYYNEIEDEKKISNYIRKIENKNLHITNLEDRIKSIANECPICFETINEIKVISGCCNNAYCEDCVIQILKTSCKCALCRKRLDPSDMIYSYIEDNVKKTKPAKITKIKQLIDIIRNNPNGKFVVFSEYNNTLDTLKEELFFHDLTVSEVKGSVGRINNIINQFDKGSINVLLLNSRNDGSGINLQNCTDVILYHKMEKFLEEQIIGRANRLGRITQLNVHRLLHENE